jgi:hypothetical protein
MAPHHNALRKHQKLRKHNDLQIHHALRSARQAYAAQIAFGATRGTAFNFATIAYLQRQPLTSIGAARASVQLTLHGVEADQRTG